MAERLAGARFVVTNTRYNLAHVRSLLGCSGPPVHLIYNGVDLRQLAPRSDDAREPGPMRLLCVARLIEQKGLVYLLESARMLLDSGADFTCEVIGAPEEPLFMNYYVRLMQCHRQLRLQDRVRFVGARRFSEIVDAYRRADVFVLPCVIAGDGSRDITPNALIEAMAMGLPVVSTTVTGVPEIVEDGVSGLLVPPGDARALALALERCFNDAELRRRLGRNARLRVERQFAIDANIAAYADLFAAAGA